VTRRLALALAMALSAVSGVGGTWPAVASAATSPIRHVFVIVLENESASTTFAPGSPAPYLSQTLRSAGAYLPNYHGIGHESNDNYIAMISGQAPNVQNQADCQQFNDFLPGTIGAYGQALGSGCVYPPSVQTIGSQLTAAGFTWRDYNEGMGADPSREAGVCAHPGIGSSDNTQKATAADQYATRHDPFVYFHSIIDDTTLCDTHVVNLNQLPQALGSPAATPNYVFITPDLCDDGHDSPCADGRPGGLAQADRFLRTWVPQITGSPAFRENGLLLVTFDEAATSDTSSCCGEIAGPGSPEPGISGPGGGDVGAVLLSPCIAPGTLSPVPYNHYSMLRSVEDTFGLSHLGYAGLPGESSFGSDVFNRSCGSAPPTASITAPPLLSSVSARARIPVSWSSSTTGGTSLAGYAVRVSDTSVRRPTWRTIAQGTRTTALAFRARLGHTYRFQVRATNLAGQVSAWAGSTSLVPSGARPPKGRFSRGWSVRRVRGAWQGRAISSGRRGATFTLRYAGGAVLLIGERTRRGGIARVTLDGRRRLIHLHAPHRLTRRVIYRAAVSAGAHRLRITVVRGTVALEGFAIASRRG
jgi:phosphatidylinositol-3-phosphatase